MLDIRCGRRNAASWNSTSITTSRHITTTTTTTTTTTVTTLRTPTKSRDVYREREPLHMGSIPELDEANPRDAIASKNREPWLGTNNQQGPDPNQEGIHSRQEEPEPNVDGLNLDLFAPSPRSIIRSHLRFPRPRKRNESKERFSGPPMTDVIDNNDELRGDIKTTLTVYQDHQSGYAVRNTNHNTGQDFVRIPSNPGEYRAGGETSMSDTDTTIDDLYNSRGLVLGEKDDESLSDEAPVDDHEHHFGDQLETFNGNTDDMTNYPNTLFSFINRISRNNTEREESGPNTKVISDNHIQKKPYTEKEGELKSKISDNDESAQVDVYGSEASELGDSQRDGHIAATSVPPMSTLDQIRATVIPSSEIVGRRNRDQSRQTDPVTYSIPPPSPMGDTTPTRYLFPVGHRSTNTNSQPNGRQSSSDSESQIEYDELQHAADDKQTRDGYKSVPGNIVEDDLIGSRNDPEEMNERNKHRIYESDQNNKATGLNVVEDKNDPDRKLIQESEFRDPSLQDSTSSDISHFESERSTHKHISVHSSTDIFDRRESEFYDNGEVGIIPIIQSHQDMSDNESDILENEPLEKFPGEIKDVDYPNDPEYFGPFNVGRNDEGVSVISDVESRSSTTFSTDDDYTDPEQQGTIRLPVNTASYNNNNNNSMTTTTTGEMLYNRSPTEEISLNKTITDRKISYNRSTTRDTPSNGSTTTMRVYNTSTPSIYERHDNINITANATIKPNINRTTFNINDNIGIGNSTVLDKGMEIVYTF